MLLVSGCRKKDVEVTFPEAPLGLKVSYEVDGQPLEFGKLKYRNDAGNVYSVTRLQYYISRVSLWNAEKGWVVVDTPFYLDAKRWPIQEFVVGQFPTGTYDSIRFHVGLQPEWNQHGKLPSTIENEEMKWPTMMGGGYHFLKLEGNFKKSDTSSTVDGYALHLGTNVALVTIRLPASITIPENGQPVEVHLRMNVNEWFNNPYDYDLSEKGYIMGDTLRMQKIAENGSDVFRLVQ